MTSNPSIYDVAVLAGVSHQTVSRVLNDHPSVRERTRIRVHAAIAELGYRPNPAARALARGHGDLIGIVATTTTLYGPASMRLSIESMALRRGYGVTVASVEELDPASLLAAANRLIDMRVRGIVAVTAVPAALGILDVLPQGMPVVLIDGDRDLETVSVGVDQIRGAELATQFLLDAGHRSVWHVAGPLDSFDARDRLTGWQETLRRAGVDVPPVINGDWTAKSGYGAGQMLARMKNLTAVFAGNDQMALGLISALSACGVMCPEDVSVVGFDNIPESEFFEPPLTTVSQDFHEVARRAIDSLLAQVEDNPVPTNLRVQPELIERSSVAPPHSVGATSRRRVLGRATGRRP